MCANESMHKQSCIHESRVFMSFVRYEKAGVRPTKPHEAKLTQTLIGFRKGQLLITHTLLGHYHAELLIGSDLAASRDLAEG